MAQVARIRRIRVEGKTGRPSEETAYVITSLTEEKADAQRLLALNRGHWEIENRLYWVRDVTFDEDRSQIRTQAAPQVFAILRNLAISVLRLRGWKNIAAGLRHLAWSVDKTIALTLLGL